MPQLVKKRRSGWAVLAAGALVASLLAVGASPAAAVDKDSEANNAAKTVACVGPATADAGFEDTVGLGAEAAINCLAYYGITTGKTASTFDPGSNVTREQMALFLHRTANVAGVDLMGGTMAANFSDIGEVGADRQAAITALARNGILMGRSSMSFMPTAEITRAEMAQALVNLLTKVPGAGVAMNTDGTYKLTPAVTGDNLDVFADAFAAVGGPAKSAITAAYEMGITTGYGDNTFRPNNPVPRKNMASFITRALAHTNARPAGLTAQAVTAGVEVSVRDASFAPVANAEIDAFRIATASAAKAFKADGTCSAAFGAIVGGGTAKCQIDPIDPVTGSTGNANLAVEATQVTADKGTTVWVWTGSMGDKVSSTTDLYEVALTPKAADAPTAERAEVSTDFPNYTANAGDETGYRAKFGTSIAFTIQLMADVDHDNDTSTDEVPTNAKPDTDGDVYRVKVTFPNGAITSTDVKMDSSGAGSFTVPGPADPRPNEVDEVTMLFSVEVQDSDPSTTVKNSPSLQFKGSTDAAASSIDGAIKFSDAAPVLFAVKAEAANEYSPAATADNPTTCNRLHATTTDQYGDPMANVEVTASSDRIITQSNTTGSVFPSAARVTFRDGKVSIAWSYNSTTAQTEAVTITASTDKTTTDEDKTASISVQWTQVAETDATGGALQAADVDSNTLILGTAPTVFMYDANDQFLDAATPITMAAFEAEVTKRLGPGGTPGTVTVGSYKAGDSDDVATFTLG